MLSLKGETDAPIPATSSSHTSEAPRCAMWCSVPLSSSYRRRACPCHGSAGGGPERRPAGFYRALDTRWQRALFGGGALPPPPTLPSDGIHGSIHGSAWVIYLLSNKPCDVFHVTDTMCAGDTERTGWITEQRVTAMFSISLGLKWPKHADVRRIKKQTTTILICCVYLLCAHFSYLQWLQLVQHQHHTERRCGRRQPSTSAQCWWRAVSKSSLHLSGRCALPWFDYCMFGCFYYCTV